jgi:CheY-like chemotaxis protein
MGHIKCELHRTVVLQTNPLPGPVLIVDDDENDILLVQRAFERAGLQNPIHIVKGGFSALAYLNGDSPYHDRSKYPLPALVLLDINMPGMDGFEVLKRIRQQKSLAHVAVVMLTSVEEIRIVTRAYHLGATSFLIKPLDFCNASELMHSLQRVAARAQLRGKNLLARR